MDECSKPVKITFVVTETEFSRLIKSMNLHDNASLRLVINHVQRYSNSTKVYLECMFLED